MSDNKKINDSELDSVAGGISDVDMSGSKTGGETKIIDKSGTKTTIEQNETVYGDKVGGNKNTSIETVYGDKIGGSKVDTDIDTDVNVNMKNSIF